MAWDDTRNGDETSQSQDIYSAAVQYDRLDSSTPPAAQYALAAASGVAVFGVMLLALSAVRRRGAPRP